MSTQSDAITNNEIAPIPAGQSPAERVATTAMPTITSDDLLLPLLAVAQGTTRAT